MPKALRKTKNSNSSRISGQQIESTDESNNFKTLEQFLSTVRHKNMSPNYRLSCDQKLKTIDAKIKQKQKIIAELSKKIETERKQVNKLEVEKVKLEKSISETIAVSFVLQSPQQILMKGKVYADSDAVQRFLGEDTQRVGEVLRSEPSTNTNINTTATQCMVASIGTIKPAFQPKYVMFGTYRCEPKTFGFDSDFIKFTYVIPNNVDVKLKSHIRIPFVEITELQYCMDHTIPTILIKPKIDSNLKVQEGLYLGNKSKNGLKFDVNSSDKRERYIAVMADGISDGFTEFIKFIKTLNGKSTINIIECNADEAKLFAK